MCVMQDTVAPTTDNFRMDDEAAITSVVEQFFSAFVSGPQARRRSTTLRTILLPDAIVVNAAGSGLAVLDVEAFIEPRIELLTHGGLLDFREWATSTRTDVFGDIAQVWCTYAKSWRVGAVQHHGAGSKSVQLVRTSQGWRISAVAWDDEPASAAPSDENVGPRT